MYVSVLLLVLMKQIRIQHSSEKVFVSEGRKTMRTLIIMGTVSKAVIHLTLRRKELVYIFPILHCF